MPSAHAPGYLRLAAHELVEHGDDAIVVGQSRTGLRLGDMAPSDGRQDADPDLASTRSRRLVSGFAGGAIAIRSLSDIENDAIGWIAACAHRSRSTVAAPVTAPRRGPPDYGHRHDCEFMHSDYALKSPCKGAAIPTDCDSNARAN